jgi:hypothetical protein
LTGAAPVVMVDAADAASVPFGVLLAGAGAVDLAAPCFEEVGGDVAVTKAPLRPLGGRAAGPGLRRRLTPPGAPGCLRRR